MEDEQSFAARGILALDFPCLAALLFVQEKKEEDHQQGDAGHSHTSRQESSTANNSKLYGARSFPNKVLNYKISNRLYPGYDRLYLKDKRDTQKQQFCT
jgi:hypothetical protein